MRQGRGFTVIELTITLVIVCILLAEAIPNFSRLMERQRVNAAGRDFLTALMYTRAQACYRGTRAALTYRQGEWSSGWLVYLDKNKNGSQDDDEPTLNEHGPLDSKIKIYTGKTVKNYIGYNAEGNSVHASNAFLSDSITFCSANAAASGFRLTISIGGRVRTEIIDANVAPCKS